MIPDERFALHVFSTYSSANLLVASDLNSFLIRDIHVGLQNFITRAPTDYTTIATSHWRWPDYGSIINQNAMQIRSLAPAAMANYVSKVWDSFTLGSRLPKDCLNCLIGLLGSLFRQTSKYQLVCEQGGIWQPTGSQTGFAISSCNTYCPSGTFNEFFVADARLLHLIILYYNNIIDKPVYDSMVQIADKTKAFSTNYWDYNSLTASSLLTCTTTKYFLPDWYTNRLDNFLTGIGSYISGLRSVTSAYSLPSGTGDVIIGAAKTVDLASALGSARCRDCWLARLAVHMQTNTMDYIVRTYYPAQATQIRTSCAAACSTLDYSILPESKIVPLIAINYVDSVDGLTASKLTALRNIGISLPAATTVRTYQTFIDSGTTVLANIWRWSVESRVGFDQVLGKYNNPPA
jgi:hypothetical protein